MDLPDCGALRVGQNWRQQGRRKQPDRRDNGWRAGQSADCRPGSRPGTPVVERRNRSHAGDCDACAVCDRTNSLRTTAPGRSHHGRDRRRDGYSTQHSQTVGISRRTKTTTPAGHIKGKNMMHLSEEELIAHAYGEGDLAAVKRHLGGCAECSNTYTALESDLAEMKFAEAPARDAGYGQRVWASLS